MTTVVIQPADDTVGYDTYLNEASPTTNAGTNASLIIGNAGFLAGNAFRTLIKFDLSSIPSGAIVQSATLSLYLYSENSNNARTASMYRLKRNWVESEATWNIYSTGNNWETAGAAGANDIDTTPVATKALSSTEAVGWKDFTITDLVQDWIDGVYSNYGVMVRVDTEIRDQYQFYSSGGTTEPKLTVEYILSSSIYVHGVQGTPAVGTETPLIGDRSVYDADVYPTLHTNDIGLSSGIHHRLGYGSDNAAPGDHTHAGFASGTHTHSEYATNDIKVILHDISEEERIEYPQSNAGLAQALAAADAGDVVEFLGTFTDNVVVPSGVSLLGLDIFNSIITGKVSLTDEADVANFSIIRSMSTGTVQRALELSGIGLNARASKMVISINNGTGTAYAVEADGCTLDMADVSVVSVGVVGYGLHTVGNALIRFWNGVISATTAWGNDPDTIYAYSIQSSSVPSGVTLMDGDRAKYNHTHNIIEYSNANVSNPPTDAELDSAFGAPATAGTGFFALLNDAGLGNDAYLVTSDGTNWWYATLTKAA